MTVAKSSNLLRPLGEFRTLLHLAPPAVSPGSTLVDILDVLAADQRPGVIMVIGEGGKLVGWIPETRLEMDVMLMLVPDAVHDSNRGLDLAAARGVLLTASQLMAPATTVTIESSLEEVLRAMIESKSRAVALVDDEQRLLGYVTMPDIIRDLVTWGG
jgi:CBS domain-containing protein